MCVCVFHHFLRNHEVLLHFEHFGKRTTWMNGKLCGFFLDIAFCGDIVIEMLKIVQNHHEILVFTSNVHSVTPISIATLTIYL